MRLTDEQKAMKIMKEKLQQWALTSEIIGAIAVVISLIYVGVGVRQNTAAIQVTNHQAIVGMDMNKNNWLRDPAFAAIHVNAGQGIDKLSPVELVQYMTFVADTVNAWEFAFITYNNGAIEDTIWRGWDGYYRSQLETQAFRSFWGDQGVNFSPDFNKYVTSLLADLTLRKN